jgi:hypothetical protein
VPQDYPGLLWNQSENFEQLQKSISSIHLPGFCDAIISPFSYFAAMGHIPPICSVPVISAW